jgi:hypothetical protein
VKWSISIFLFVCLSFTGTCEDLSSREKIVKVGTELVGTQEATGRNDGEVVEKILNSVGLSKGAPYCAAFNYWCYLQAGESSKVPRSGWSPDWVRNPSWKRSSGGETPKPGDAFGIFFKSKNRVAHTGLVKKWGNSIAITVEGNTAPEAAAGSAADRDGGGIWSKRRLKNQIYSVKNWLD